MRGDEREIVGDESGVRMGKDGTEGGGRCERNGDAKEAV